MYGSACPKLFEQQFQCLNASVKEAAVVLNQVLVLKIERRYATTIIILLGPG